MWSVENKISSESPVSDVVVDERTLGVHQVELVVDAGEDFGNGGAVGDPRLRKVVQLLNSRLPRKAL